MRQATFIAVVAALTATSGLSAQGWIDPVRPTPQWGVVKLRTSVSVRVSGRVARVEVEEYFQNRGGAAMGESDYLYPLPGEAVFSNFSLYQGDQELRGETMDANRARGIYEEIVRSKRDPALIELAGHGLLRARVFPIAAGETRKITLRYTQLLHRAGDALQFRYAAGARNTAQPRPRVNGVEQPTRVADAVPLTFTMAVDNGAEFRDAFSPTHDVRSERSDGRLVIRPRNELSGDFALFLPLAANAVGISVVSHRPSGENGFFMMTLTPGEARESTVARDITAVIDVSGSMSGEKMQQSRAALRQLLNTLTPRDRFRLIAFSNEVRSYRPDYITASQDELTRARTWIDQLSAEGGTNISGALTEAFRQQPGEGRLGIVFFMTDGLPSVGEQNPERIAQRAEQDRGQNRVFAFGVGYDVNTYLLDRLSAAARGVTHYVQPGENVEPVVATLAAKVRFPVLANLRLAELPVQISEVYPRDVPDLFAGEDLVVFGRYSGGSAAEVPVVVTGQRNGRTERYQSRAVFPVHENGNDFIPRLWASRKLGWLTQQLRLNGQNPETIEEIRETALRYGLLSEYTSYLVQEPVAVVAQERQRAAVGGGRGAGGGFRGEATGQVAAANPVGTPPPVLQTGQAAVQQAQRERRSQDVRTTAEVDAMQYKLEDASSKLSARADGATKTVSGRHFRLDGKVWKDVMHTSSKRIVVVEPFSAAYFALLRQLPELESYAKSFDQLLVAGKRASVQITTGGSKTLPPAELTKLVAEFRGH